VRDYWRSIDAVVPRWRNAGHRLGDRVNVLDDREPLIVNKVLPPGEADLEGGAKIRPLMAACGVMLAPIEERIERRRGMTKGF